MRAVEAASDALFRSDGDARGAAGSGRSVGREAGDARPEPKQRRADAVGLLAERALAAGFAGGECRGSDGDGNTLGRDLDELDGAQTAESNAALRGAPAETPGAKADLAANTSARVGSGTRAERYQVMVHCDAATLAAEGEPGRSDLDGIRVSAETSRRMACEAAVVAMVHAKDGSMLSVGRRTRTIPPHIRRALEERDRGCRFPGCGCQFTEAHHVKHWADGGETSLRNTLLLCRRHHRAVHEGRMKVSVNSDGTVLFFTPKGRMLVDAPSRPKAARDDERSGLPAIPSVHAGAPADTSLASLPVPSVHPGARAETAGASLPVPSVHAGAPARGKDPILSNGAALYRDSAIPWEIEAAAREAMEESSKH